MGSEMCIRDRDLTPSISSATLPTASPLQVTIVGEGLSVAEEASAGEGVLPAISIGRVPCSVIERSDVSITCELPHALRPGANKVNVRIESALSEAILAAWLGFCAWVSRLKVSAKKQPPLVGVAGRIPKPTVSRGLPDDRAVRMERSWSSQFNASRICIYMHTVVRVVCIACVNKLIQVAIIAQPRLSHYSTVLRLFCAVRCECVQTFSPLC